MAATNDRQAHDSSLPSPYPELNSRALLNGDRPHFDFESNQIYRMPAEEWAKTLFSLDDLTELVHNYVYDFYTKQVPRIVTLQRYYNGDNDIHYWNSTKTNKTADNRISSGFAKYITSLRVGYQFGNPLDFQFNDPDVSEADQENIQGLVDKFNDENDESSHEKNMAINLMNTGRAYELMYVHEGTNDPAFAILDPANTFVVYDTTINQHSLFAVNFNYVSYNHHKMYYVDVYTDMEVIHFKAEDSLDHSLELIGNFDTHYFRKVPITEFRLNSDRVGAWESKLDAIDAYDKSMSEMANSQENFNNANLLISGDIKTSTKVPILDENGEAMYDDQNNQRFTYKKIDPNDRIIYLKPAIRDNEETGSTTVIPSDAKYLTKELNADGWLTYMKRLEHDIHKDTNTPDMTDEAFSGNTTGEALSYKLWGTDQEIAMQKSLYEKGIKRRLALLGNYWQLTNKVTNPDLVTKFQIGFTNNLPKNDAKIIDEMVKLKQTGVVSDETIQDNIEPVTGVDAEIEAQRVAQETDAAQQKAFDISKIGMSDEELSNDDANATGPSKDKGAAKPGQEG